MTNHRDLDALDAAELVEDEINRLIDTAPRGLLHTAQLRDAAHSVPSNIAEGFGRGPGAERQRALRVAKGEAEETIRHLRANAAAQRISMKVFLRLRNRLITICKMLNRLLH